MVNELQEISFAELPKMVFVDFRICADSLNPEEVSTNLGITPSRAFAKGEKYLGKTRNPESKEISEVWRERPRGIWAIDSKKLSIEEKVEDHIKYLLEILEPLKKQLKLYLDQRDIYTISFYIWWEPQGGYGSFEVSSEIIRRMSSLCHYIEFAFL